MNGGNPAAASAWLAFHRQHRPHTTMDGRPPPAGEAKAAQRTETAPPAISASSDGVGSGHPIYDTLPGGAR